MVAKVPLQTPVKEKKPKASSKPPAPSHPPYFQMIKEAITALNEKSGSSPYAIAKHMEEKHRKVLPANFRKMLAVQLKNFAAKGKLVKVKASFKLSGSGKKEEEKKKPKALKPLPPSGALKRKMKVGSGAAKSPKTGKVMKKAKRASTAKPKQIKKSIRSPVAKRARKAAA